MTSRYQIHQTVSRDGTEVGYVSRGEGPPLLLIHPALGDHTRWGPLLPYLEPHFTVYAMDRRGRGLSDDHPEYSIEREYEDVVAVVDDIAGESGALVDAYGSSSGGYYAFGAAAITANIRRLVLYEGWPLVDPDATTPPAELLDRVEAKLAEGDREGALETVYREYLQLTKEEFEELRAQPSWPTRVAAAHTIPRESRPGADPKLDPDQAARITVPTLLLVGEESPEHLKVGSEHVVDALPNARVAILKGQGHAADLFAPQVIADVLLSFLREQP